MREILFRGKLLDKDEWVYGYLVPITINCHDNGYEIIDSDGITYDELDHYQPVLASDRVDPTTVGQYTGLTDKNGKKIFEGDIVDMGDNWWDAYGPAGHDSQKTIVRWSEEHCGFDPFANYDCDCNVYIHSELCTVIGNIHDNPEILDGGAE